MTFLSMQCVLGRLAVSSAMALTDVNSFLNGLEKVNRHKNAKITRVDYKTSDRIMTQVVNTTIHFFSCSTSFGALMPGSPPGILARISKSINQGAVMEPLGAQLPRAHWIGPEDIVY